MHNSFVLPLLPATLAVPTSVMTVAVVVAPATLVEVVNEALCVVVNTFCCVDDVDVLPLLLVLESNTLTGNPDDVVNDDVVPVIVSVDADDMVIAVVADTTVLAVVTGDVPPAHVPMNVLVLVPTNGAVRLLGGVPQSTCTVSTTMSLVVGGLKESRLPCVSRSTTSPFGRSAIQPTASVAGCKYGDVRTSLTPPDV